VRAGGGDGLEGLRGAGGRAGQALDGWARDVAAAAQQGGGRGRRLVVCVERGGRPAMEVREAGEIRDVISDFGDCCHQ
jgi:hypothetical protein